MLMLSAEHAQSAEHTPSRLKKSSFFSRSIPFIVFAIVFPLPFPTNTRDSDSGSHVDQAFLPPPPQLRYAPCIYFYREKVSALSPPPPLPLASDRARPDTPGFLREDRHCNTIVPVPLQCRLLAAAPAKSVGTVWQMCAEVPAANSSSVGWRISAQHRPERERKGARSFLIGQFF